MSGFMGFGQSGGEKSATSNLNNVFGYGLDTSKASQKSGSGALGDAASYFKSLLTAGRKQTAQNSAPAVNAQLAQTDAARKQEATTGTGRSGGTVEANREASTTSMKSIDDIINKNMIQGREAGAAGLESIGGTELQNALQALGISSGTQQSLYSGAIQKEGQQSQGFGDLFGGAIQDATGLGLAKALGVV
jgi:hypothetical protein